ncbi:uncharacterized protein ACLA_003200 [Aspergillus clavatus NRRL 1]|uniref:Uncharacterized protein n=1 Tax=Aspergillus clavatus (strain ATCC 1007 / CBS 513.65 / DSM 816 / NCTC 3887 / NRRL 1 / QM 1276 / 107) TaxID=344612 RepID=A1C5E0_ASPCL|nr:uncharacterized protein ACLA_003200 [Aspergillus clavatus NRRL 1]EAW14908.1 conserved hypothetical protein [Aspergillus clavatus NRRL 1]
MSRPAPSGSKPEKTMSSRLLTMKFMQRAAATAATKEASQPSSAAGSPKPISKRQRLSTDGLSPSPGATPSSDLEAISAALAAEEEKRREALARQAADAGESEWVLDYPGAVETGEEYAAEPLVIAADSLDADDDDLVNGGRQAYGNFKRKNRTVQYTSTNDGDAEDPDQIDSMIKKAKQDASRQKPVRLSQLTSISGGRQSLGGDKSQKKRKHK